MGRQVGDAYVVRGFLFLTDRRHFTDAALYGDWVGETRSKWALREELAMGAFPQGLILQGPEGVMVVVGRTGQRNQKLAPLAQALPGLGQLAWRPTAWRWVGRCVWMRRL